MPTFSDIQRWVTGLEATILDLLSALTPWLAPFIPAYMVFHNTQAKLGFPWAVALVGAASAEFLGLITVHTALTFWRYNQTKRERSDAAIKGKKRKDRKVRGAEPMLLALFVSGFYIALVIMVNAVLELTTVPEVVAIFPVWVIGLTARAMLSMMSVVAALTIALRAGHARRLSDAQRKHLATPIGVAGAPKSEPRIIERGEFLAKWQENLSLPPDDRLSIAALSHKLGVLPRKGQRWVEGLERKNGKVADDAG